VWLCLSLRTLLLTLTHAARRRSYGNFNSSPLQPAAQQSSSSKAPPLQAKPRNLQGGSFRRQLTT
jgi:hypothetical protein